MGVALYLSKVNKEVIDMPNSLQVRIKKCVHKGLLKEEDFKRIVILPPYASLDCKETLRTSYEKAYTLGYDAAMEEVKKIVFNRYALIENSYEDVCALIRRWENERAR